MEVGVVSGGWGRVGAKVGYGKRVAAATPAASQQAATFHHMHHTSLH